MDPVQKTLEEELSESIPSHFEELYMSGMGQYKGRFLGTSIHKPFLIRFSMKTHSQQLRSQLDIPQLAIPTSQEKYASEIRPDCTPRWHSHEVPFAAPVARVAPVSPVALPPLAPFQIPCVAAPMVAPPQLKAPNFQATWRNRISRGKGISPEISGGQISGGSYFLVIF